MPTVNVPPACAGLPTSERPAPSTIAPIRRWISVARPSRRAPWALLRMRELPDAIKNQPHAEERPEGASRSTHNADAAHPQGVTETGVKSWILLGAWIMLSSLGDSACVVSFC